jgi:hypothetical protein
MAFDQGQESFREASEEGKAESHFRHWLSGTGMEKVKEISHFYRIFPNY